MRSLRGGLGAVGGADETVHHKNNFMMVLYYYQTLYDNDIDL